MSVARAVYTDDARRKLIRNSGGVASILLMAPRYQAAIACSSGERLFCAVYLLDVSG